MDKRRELDLNIDQAHKVQTKEYKDQHLETIGAGGE